ncbi:hypothetical protein RIF29_06047 [Crotalaria pallida]|uniref:Uncharacterized protein n=1 Tax=Crotalaria pallida TaxID=3830 RepID=A0AAN9PB15_CROPI
MARLPKLRQTDTTLIRYDFSDDTNEFDLEKPTPGFASIPEAIEDIRCYSYYGQNNFLAHRRSLPDDNSDPTLNIQVQLCLTLHHRTIFFELEEGTYRISSLYFL